MTRLPVALLIEDGDIYPRANVDSHHVTVLTDALLAGAVLPPVIIEAGTRKIVDGWHRVRAAKAAYGVDAEVEVEERTYADAKALFEDAVALNARHGKALEPIDRKRIVRLGEALGILPAALAGMLFVSAGQVQTMRFKMATAPPGGPGIPTPAGMIPGTRDIALKRSVEHLAGHTFTPVQAAAHPGAPGLPYAALARQIINGIAGDLLDGANAHLRATLVELRDAVDAWLAVTPPPPDASTDASN